MRVPIEEFRSRRMQDNEELRDLKDELEDAERKLQEAEEEVDGIRDEIRALEKKLETKPECPRCGLSQTPEPELNAICCPKCGYCEAVAAGTPESCSYHGETEASG